MTTRCPHPALGSSLTYSECQQYINISDASDGCDLEVYYWSSWERVENIAGYVIAGNADDLDKARRVARAIQYLTDDQKGYLYTALQASEFNRGTLDFYFNGWTPEGAYETTSTVTASLTYCVVPA